MSRLSQLSVGQQVKVLQISQQGGLGQRLMEMGVTPGVAIRLIGAAPLGDPLEFEVRGYRLCMRRSEADCVEVGTL